MNSLLNLLGCLHVLAGSLGALLGELLLLLVLFRRGLGWAVGCLIVPQLLLLFVAVHPRLSARPLAIVGIGLLIQRLGVWLVGTSSLP